MFIELMPRRKVLESGCVFYLANKKTATSLGVAVLIGSKKIN